MPKLLLIPVLAAVICQALKLLLLGIRTHRFPWNAVDAYGGMPSTHTAMVAALMTVIAFSDDFDSSHFAIVVVFSLIVVRDAIGFRRYLGWHSEALNNLIRNEPIERQKSFRQYTEQIGHTPLQASIGAILGVGIAWLLYSVIP